MEIPCGVWIDNTSSLVSPRTPCRSAATPSNFNGRSSCLQTPAALCSTPRSCRTRKVARTPSKTREETEPFDSLLESFVLELEQRDCSYSRSSKIHFGKDRLARFCSTASESSLFNSGAKSSNFDVNATYGQAENSARRNRQLHSSDEKFLLGIPIKLEDLFSDNESTELGKGQTNFFPRTCFVNLYYTIVVIQLWCIESSHRGSERNSEGVADHHSWLLTEADSCYEQNLKQKGVMGLLLNVLEQRQLKQRAERKFQKKIMTKCFTKVSYNNNIMWILNFSFRSITIAMLQYSILQ